MRTPNTTSAVSSAVTLELTGPLERAVGAAEVTLPAAADDRLGNVLAALVRQYPAAVEYLADEAFFAEPAGGIPSGLLVVRDGAVIAARLETAVAAGQRLTLMPMISGG